MTVTAPNIQTAGQPLTLTCNATAARGIASKVDIVWSRGSNIVKIVVNSTPSTIDSSLVYTDTYIISPLSTDDGDRGYGCTITIHTSPVIRNRDNVILNVTGKYHNDCLLCYCSLDVFKSYSLKPVFKVT